MPQSARQLGLPNNPPFYHGLLLVPTISDRPPLFFVCYLVALLLFDGTDLLCRYFDALEEVAAVRIAEANGQAMPEWVPFSASEECQLCKADFSWASTSSSEVKKKKELAFVYIVAYIIS